jgi:hypothetical protein
MKDGKDGRPTPGLKIVAGKSAWQMISLGDSCDLRLLMAAGSSPLFQSYLFADYSGAADPTAQKRSIKVAYANANEMYELIKEPLTRDSLVDKVLQYLRVATTTGKRTCIGFDHMFGLPFVLLEEIGIEKLNWRQLLDAVVEGRGLPPLRHPSTYAKQFNDWCSSRGKPPYFYSATKASLYGIPACDPRAGKLETVARLTERCDSVFGRGKPKPFNRVGDNGTVGGQTIMGLSKLRELLVACQQEGIPVKCWPFDGLDISSQAYAGSHVLLEIYPAAVRAVGVARTDANDAIACVQFIQQFDQEGKLVELLDLSRLPDAYKDIVQVEGWIAGLEPNGGKITRLRQT